MLAALLCITSHAHGKIRIACLTLRGRLEKTLQQIQAHHIDDVKALA